MLLAPPNGGSDIVDTFRDWASFQALNGPAGLDLGTRPDSIVRRLPDEPDIETGIIAGNRPINPFLAALLPGANDGKISVQSAFAMTAKEKHVLPVSHTWMATNKTVIQAVMTFLDTGSFGEKA